MPFDLSVPSIPFIGGGSSPRPPTAPGGPQPPRPPPTPANGPLFDPARRQSKAVVEQTGFGIPNMGSGGGGGSSSSSYSVTCILFTGIVFVIAVFVTIAALVNSLHRVKEGNVAIYFSSGALLKEIAGPGVHWSTPFITTMHQITIRPETHYLHPLDCTTSDGVVNVFREIAVISSLERERVHYLVETFGHDIKQVLVYDRITEGIQAFCANHTIDDVFNTKFLQLSQSVQVYLNESITRFAQDGIMVWNLFIPKPQIPPAIAANYREVKIEWTRQLVAQQKMKTERIKKETILQNAKLDAQRLNDVRSIDMQGRLNTKEREAQVQAVQNQMAQANAQAKADADAYMATSQAQANQALLTDQYIKLQIAKAMTNNTKVFFSGQDSTLGGLLTKLFT